LHRQSGNFGDALDCYEAVLKIKPGHWKAQLNRAASLLGLGRAEEAQSALDRAIQIGGGSPSVSWCPATSFLRALLEEQ
jgi:Flp pilus assembly protein TadD